MTNLRQCYNALTVVGTLKSKEVKYGTTDNGDSTISLELTIVSNESDKIHENKIRFWAKNTSKLYNSYVTVANEYKTIANDGAANADRIKVTGSLEMNEYFNTNANELKTYNNLRGVFINRLDKDLVDEVGAVVECVITGHVDEISKEGAPTGRKKVNILTVGYNSIIHEIQNVVVEKELAQQFTQMYGINSTGKLYLKINNYSEKAEDEQQAQPQIGFGSTLSNMPDTVVKNYINEIVIVGGDMPSVANKFTVEEINEMIKRRELSRNEKMNSVPSTPPAPTGFGTGFGDTQSQTQSTRTFDNGSLPF